MRKQIGVIGAFVLASGCARLEHEGSPLDSKIVVQGSRRDYSITLASLAHAEPELQKEPPEIEIPVWEPKYDDIEYCMAFANTHAISCRDKNELCEQLEVLGIRPRLLRDSTKLFSDDPETTESFEAFEKRMAEALQPEAPYGELPYEVRLENSTEILARSSLGVYQIIYRYWAEEVGKKYQGEEGRRNMYEFIHSKEAQDELVTKIITSLGGMHDWNMPVMVAHYYGGSRFVKAMRAKTAGSDEYDDFLSEKLYHGYPSVLEYLEGSEDFKGFDHYMKTFAENEGLDINEVSREDWIRFFRYAIALKESSFDMQKFERGTE
jgi:hypothetical protein